MDSKSVASKPKELGERCRMVRQTKGLSQQQLGDMVNVTAQAISKWEKEGLSNITHIMALSNALGQNLLDDQFDQEGTVGEVGKEILSLLIAFDGLTDFRNIVYNLYGMKSDRVSNELFKLGSIGAVVREQYTDFKNEDRDVVFITAKGVIIYKNMGLLGKTISKDLVTYDEILAEGYNSYQDVVDNDKVTTILASLDNEGLGFRCDYITYLLREHFNPRETENRLKTTLYSYPETKDDCLCGESCYVDILRRLIQGTNRKEVDKLLLAGLRFWEPDPNEVYEEPKDYTYEATGLEDTEIEAIKSIFGNIETMGYEFSNELMEGFDIAEKIETYKHDNKIDLAEEEQKTERIYEFSDLPDREFDFIKRLPEEIRYRCDKWFSENEIRKFIDENYLPPKTEKEIEIDKKLHQIWDADESTLDYYYSFPDKWEENGLAGFIREKVGVPERKENKVTDK
jgi:transcriptional regulator with XRE-family HTH domain